jgi:hypothetical protein
VNIEVLSTVAVVAPDPSHSRYAGYASGFERTSLWSFRPTLLWVDRFAARQHFDELRKAA